MAIDIIARGLATSLLGSNGKIASDKMPTMEGTSELTGFFPVGKLTDPSLVEGKTAEEILLMMLFGVVSPTLTAPSLKITLSEESSTLIAGRQTQIKGALKFDRGSIDPAYGTSGYRAGLPTSYQIADQVIETAATTYDFTLDLTPTMGANVISYSVEYAAGDQPLNSIGQPYDAPLVAGSLSGILTLDAVYPLYNSAAEEVEFTWFEDEDGSGYMSVFMSEGSGTKQSFAVASDVTVVGIKGFDDLSQTWTWLGGETAEVSLTYFDTTTITGESLGETTDYVLYTHNYFQVGERELRIYVN